MRQEIVYSKTKLNILVLILFLSTLRSSVFWPLYVNTDALFSAAWIEISAWILLTVFIIRALKKEDSLQEFVALWRKEIFLLVFLSFSILSLFWSISFSASLYRISILLMSTIAGAYIGYLYGSERLLNILFWFGAIIVILSFEFSLVLPEFSVMSGWPYNGAWRGMFWHRNHLGAIIALFNLVFIIRLLKSLQGGSSLLGLDVFFYIISLVLIYFAKSAAGYILTIVLNLSVLTLILWLRYVSRIKSVHYFAFLGIAILGVILVLSNLEFILGIFNRTPNLTGRIPMWDILLKNVVYYNPWVGYGFGAIWTFESFRIGMQHAVGWSFPVLIGDNGFMDILLHVGLIGLILFLAIWVKMWVISIRNILSRHEIQEIFPLVFMIFTLLANITFSLFLETESFVWLTMIAVLFALKKSQSRVA